MAHASENDLQKYNNTGVYSENTNRTKWKIQQCCNFIPELHRIYRTTGVKAPLLKAKHALKLKTH